MSAAKRLSSMATDTSATSAAASSNSTSSSTDFYSVIMETRRAAVCVPEEAIWGSKVVDD